MQIGQIIELIDRLWGKYDPCHTSIIYYIPRFIQCNKCLAFWSCLIYQLTTVNPIEAMLTAAIAAILSIVIYNRL